jgi:OOP family OmpA-OmpF porin
LEVAGHTDQRASAEYNEKLSRRRADAVRDYLIGKGVSADRLSAAGYGETKPVADNNTEAGRQQNRRVEFAAK